MKITVLGATGSVGREITAQALAAGHAVTALVRDRPASRELDARVALVVGDATDLEAVNDAVDGSSVVISALGRAKGGPDDMLARAASNLIAAMRMHQVDRLVVLSSAAVKDPQDEPSVFYRLARVLLRVVMPAGVNDHQAQARLLEDSGLAWTLVRGPLIFTDEPHTGRYRAGLITRHTGSHISRADLADFMLAASTDEQHVQLRPFVSQWRQRR